MNETLRRTLLRARLTEEDVAARLQVDPKTVRRWLEGRVPYPRHRWILADALGLDEAELWPQISPSRSWPSEVQAIYPHREDIPHETWLRLFGSAREVIDILAGSETALRPETDLLAILADRAAVGVKERICLPASDIQDAGPQVSPQATNDNIRGKLKQYLRLQHCGDVEIRLHTHADSNCISRADNECLVASAVFGIPHSRSPVLHLSRTGTTGLFQSYVESFETIWQSVSSARIADHLL